MANIASLCLATYREWEGGSLDTSVLRPSTLEVFIRHSFSLEDILLFAGRRSVFGFLNIWSPELVSVLELESLSIT